MLRLSWVVAALAACGSNSTKSDTPVSTTIQTVSCTGITPAATVSTTATSTAYSQPSTTITMGQVVQFTMASAHNVSSTTPGLAVDFGQTKCLQFTATGMFHFMCSVHGFTGTITVQ
jgi:plastocyanin